MQLCVPIFVLVPLRLDPRTVSPPTDADERYDLAGAVLCILALRPLIEAGIVRLIPYDLCFCKDHLRQAVPNFNELIGAADVMARELAPKFQVIYEARRSQPHQAAFSISGPDDYIEHGKINYVLTDEPKWARRARQNRTKIPIPTALVRQHKVISGIFNRIVNDACVQQYFGSAYNARYVTDLPGEAELFRRLNGDDDLASMTADLCAQLTHSVPLFSDAPLETVLKIRSEEPEAFLNYRAAVTGIVKEHVGPGKVITKLQAQQIYQDVLRPQVISLETQAKNDKRARVKTAALKGLASAAVVTLSIYGGVFPAHLADMVKAVGGVSLAKDLTEAVGGIHGDGATIRNDNLYFLLRLKRATGL